MTTDAGMEYEYYFKRENEIRLVEPAGTISVQQCIMPRVNLSVAFMPYLYKDAAMLICFIWLKYIL